MTKNAPTPMRDYFHATGAELREWADTDPAAAAEVARRKDRRAAKVAARAEAPAAA